MERVFKRGNFSLRYELDFSRRKTLAIHITDEGNVLVKAPNRCPQAFIEDFIFSRRKWIEERTLLQKLRMEKKSSFAVADGDFLSLLGSEYPVKWGKAVSFGGMFFTIPKWKTEAEFSAVKNKLIVLYKQIAEPIFLERTAYYSAIIGVKPASVKLSSAKNPLGLLLGEEFHQPDVAAYNGEQNRRGLCGCP